MRAPIELAPIGWVSCPAQAVADVPSEGVPSDVVLREQYAPALTGIEPGDHLYVVAIFDRADPDQLSGSTGTEHEQGAFSIRSSSRPNRLGLTLARVTAVRGTTVSFDWLDFADRTPVVDLKRYNWRWECVLSARRLDRRFIERQIDRSALQAVLARPAANFHGERCVWVERAARLGARLVHERHVWLGDPDLRVGVRGDGHLVDAVQGLTGATHGNGRLTVELAGDDTSVSFAVEGDQILAEWDGHHWHLS